MTIDVAMAKIAMLEENNQKLSELVNFLVSKPGPATIAYQRVLAESKKDEKLSEEVSK